MRLSSSRVTSLTHRPQQDFPLWDKAGTRPSLDLQFADRRDLVDATTGSNLVDFTRASSGTYVGSDGLIVTAATDEARFDHDPTTGESLGLLVEESRSNLLLNSATLATQNVTVTAVAHTLSFYGTGTVTLSGTHSATVVGTGAYPSRATLTFTPTAGTLTVTVSGTVEYANLEIDAGGLGASFSTSYIPTEGSTVTRAADVASISGSNFSSWYRQDEGSIYSDFIRTYSGNFPNFPNIYNINDGTGTNRIAFFGGQNAQFFRPQITVSSSDQLNFVTLPSIVPGPNKAAHSFKLNASDFSANGSVTAQDTSVSIPTVTTMNIGVGFGQQFTGCLRRLTYWPSKLAASTLQTITQ